MHPLPRVALIQGGASPEKLVALTIDSRWCESVELGPLKTLVSTMQRTSKRCCFEQSAHEK